MANSMDADLKTLTEKQFEELLARFDKVFDIYEVKKGSNRRDKEAALLKLVDTVKSPDVKEHIEKTVATALQDAKNETKDNLKALSDKDLDALSARYDAVFEKYEVKKGTNRQEKEEAFLKLMDAVPPINQREMSQDLAKATALQDAQNKTKDNLKALSDKDLDALSARYDAVFEKYEVKKGTNRQEKEEAFLKLMNAVPSGNQREMSEDLAKVLAPPNEPTLEEIKSPPKVESPPMNTSSFSPTLEDIGRALERLQKEKELNAKKEAADKKDKKMESPEILTTAIEVPNKIPGIPPAVRAKGDGGR